jgi:hypothetical protein
MNVRVSRALMTLRAPEHVRSTAQTPVSDSGVLRPSDRE